MARSRATTRSLAPRLACHRRSGPWACAIRSPSPCSPVPVASTSMTSARVLGRRSTSVRPAPTTAGRPPRARPQIPFSLGPLLAYRHSATTPPGSGPGGFFTGCAIAGGTFYPDAGPFPPAYRGNYFFADLCTSFVARLDLANGNAVYSFGAVPGQSGRHAGGQRRCAAGVDAQQHRALLRALARRRLNYFSAFSPGTTGRGGRASAAA